MPTQGILQLFYIDLELYNRNKVFYRRVGDVPRASVAVPTDIRRREVAQAKRIIEGRK